MNIHVPILLLVFALCIAPSDAEADANRCRSIEPAPLDPDNLRWDSTSGAASVDLTAMGDRFPGETYSGSLTRTAEHTNGRKKYNFLFKTPYTAWRQEIEYVLIPSSAPRDPDVYFLRGVMYTYEDGARHLDILIAGLEVRCTFGQ